MRTGHCLCGRVSYELTGEPLAVGVCHCDHCQRQSGSAFSVNLVVHESQVTITGDLHTYEETSDDGLEVFARRRFCGTCGSPIVTALTRPRGILALKADSLDDRSDVRPSMEAWCVDRQPWVALPGMDISLERKERPPTPLVGRVGIEPTTQGL